MLEACSKMLFTVMGFEFFDLKKLLDRGNLLPEKKKYPDTNNALLVQCLFRCKCTLPMQLCITNTRFGFWYFMLDVILG